MTPKQASPRTTADAPAEPVRFLAADGTFAPTEAAAAYQDLVDELTREDLERFYADMVLSRVLDQQATNLQRQGQLALWPPSRGQEAAQVGSVRAAREQDHIFPSYREHIVAVTRGVDPVDIARVMRGDSLGGWNPTTSNGVHIYTLVLGAQTLHATGYGMGLVFDDRTGTGNPETDEAVIVYYGDGASSQGDVHEAMVYSASYNAPVVFFVQNNQWAISVPFETQSKVPLYTRGAGYGIEGVQVDGNDVIASYAVSRRALENARSGKGPQLIEAVTYRMGAHTTSDDPTKYRRQEEEREWAERDPIARLRAYLESLGTPDEVFEKAAADAAAAADDLRIRTGASVTPPAESMFANVYSEPNPTLAAQQRWLGEYERSFEASDGGSQ